MSCTDPQRPPDEMYAAGWNDALLAIDSAWRAADGDFECALWKLRHSAALLGEGA